MTNYLLCVLIILMAYTVGEVSGKQPPIEERPNGGVVMVLALIASLVLGVVLNIVVGVIYSLIIGRVLLEL